MKPVITSVGG